MAKISCPRCNAPYYWNRRDKRKYLAGYDVPVACECGLKYWIVKNTNGRIISVRKDIWNFITSVRHSGNM